MGNSWIARLQQAVLLSLSLSSFFRSPVHAELSLFFSPQELTHLKKDATSPKQQLTLWAILYFDKDHWSLWINEHVIHPDSIFLLPNISIEKVTPNEVTFSYISKEEDIQKTFILYPQGLEAFSRTRDENPEQRH